MKFLFLYTEIAEYFLACCNELSKHGEVHIVRWPTNTEAPFQFNFGSNMTVYDKNNYSLIQLDALVKNINPTVIVCSGWIDNDYLKITKSYYKKIPTVMTCDTQWKGSLKQRVATIISRWTLLRIFSHAWIPGQIQKKYAIKLGFKESCILTGFYSCDSNYFETIYQTQKHAKQDQFPQRFLFVGRYYDFKGISELWQAFIELQQEFPNHWELWCLGTGDLIPIEHPKIKHFGFIQPSKLAQYTAQTGVFVLPSRFEPWGVVVHEYATSGFPLLLSNKVGAKELFLHDGENGFEFESNNIQSIKKALQQIIDTPNDALIQMGVKSNQISKQISPKIWANSLLEILN